jgi:fumarate hydratase class II
MAQYAAALDQGTTSTRCMIFDHGGNVAAVEQLERALIPAVRRLRDALARKATEFSDVVKSGRTHLMDATPVTLGQEFGGYAAQVREGRARIDAALERLGRVDCLVNNLGIAYRAAFDELLDEQ